MKEVIFCRVQLVRTGRKVCGEAVVFSPSMPPGFTRAAWREALFSVPLHSTSGHPPILIRRRLALQHFLRTDCWRRCAHTGLTSHFRQHWRDGDDNLVMFTLRRVMLALRACHAKKIFARQGSGESIEFTLSLCNVCKMPSGFLPYASLSYAVFRFIHRIMAYPERPFEAPSGRILTAISHCILPLAEHVWFWRLDGSAS